MKREIQCKKCALDLHVQEYPGEGYKKVYGRLVGSCYCDVCNVTLSTGDYACAVSFFLNGEYYGWENEFIERQKI